MLFRLILLVATLLQAAAVPTGPAQAQFQYPAFTRVICKGATAPAAPHSPNEHDGSCSDCITCCSAQPPILCVFELLVRQSLPTTRNVILTSAILPAPRTHSETPPARAPPV
ncbi:MAG: hypothetical protein FJX15_13730 [Alphaproteobacteria bacterium]|nr:hypothetical protein [Alphaproteobacteria bacterium]